MKWIVIIGLFPLWLISVVLTIAFLVVVFEIVFGTNETGEKHETE